MRTRVQSETLTQWSSKNYFGYALISMGVGKSKIIAEKGLILAIQGRYSEAISILEEHLPLAKEYGQKNLTYLYFIRLASIYERVGDFDKAIEYMDNTDTFPKDSISINEKFGVLITKGSIYSKKGQFAESIGFFQQAISLARSDTIISKSNLAIAHNNLGLLLQSIRRLDEALAEFQISIDINTQINNKLGLSQNLNNIANVYKDLQDYPTSIRYMLESVNVNKSVNANASLIRNYYNLGEIYLNLKEIDKAFEYFTMGYDMSKRESFNLGIMYNASGLANIHIQNRQPRLAINYANESNILAQESKTLDIVGNNYNSLRLANEQLNDFRSAYNYAKQFHQVQDSLTDARSKREIEEVRSSFQLELLSNQNELLEQQVVVYELRFRRQVLTVVILLIILLSIGTILFVINKNKKKLDLKNKQLEVLNIEKETLTNVIVHDLRNPLTGLIGSLDLLNDEKLSSQQSDLVKIALTSTKKVSEMVDGLLEVSEMKDELIDEAIQLTDIKSLCLETIELFNPRAKMKDIRISSRLDDLTLATHPPYITRILGNLLSNSLKFSDSGSEIYVEASINKLNKVWKLRVFDQGPGFTDNDKASAFQMFQKLSATPKAGENSSGLGLYTVNLLTNKLGGSVKIEDNSPKGAIITCEFPLASVK